MPHQINRCRCGKTIHWSKSATVGDVWVCRRCNTRNIMVAEGGQRGKIVRSKPYASATPTTHRDTSSTASTRSSPPAARWPSSAQQTATPAGCFPSGSGILTPVGYKPIECFNVGDLVLSWNAASSRLRAQPVTRALAYAPADIWSVCFVDARSPLHVTGSHKFQSNRGWISTSDLREGEQLLDLSSRDGMAIVAMARPTGRSEAVYNLHTAGDHNYIVDGLVAHNFAILRRLRTVVHRIFIDYRTADGRAFSATPAREPAL